MFKKILCLVMVLTAVFTLSVQAFADENTVAETDAQAQTETGNNSTVEDELPDIDVTSWEFRLANSYNSISLYDATVSYVYGMGIDQRIYENLVSFIEDTRSAGYPAYLNCANFSWLYYECGHYESLIKQKYGDAYHASLNETGPGCDDHQTGLSFDLAVDPSYAENFDNKDPYAKESETYQWMKEHCAEYGFIVRFPEDKSDYYGVGCSGAHFRYVGVEAATYIMEHDLCLEEFLLLYDYPVRLGTEVKDGASEKDNYAPAA